MSLPVKSLMYKKFLIGAYLDTLAGIVADDENKEVMRRSGLREGEREGGIEEDRGLIPLKTASKIFQYCAIFCRITKNVIG